ncbi:MAG TPA: hypothetical protein VIV40_24950 [Kofleriaceae bacterium]
MRWHAALTALLFVVGSWIGLLHEATTSHVRCAEHGELIHGVAAADQAATTQVTNPTVRDLAPIAPRELGHDHCLLTSAVHSVSIASRVPVVATALTTAPTAIEAPLYVVARADLFRTAPKTSPPV